MKITTKMKRRVVSALLALTMLIPYVPAPTWALGDWDGNASTIHLTKLTVNSNGTWSVTFAGSGTTSGALAIVPNFDKEDSMFTMGAQRDSVGTDSNTANAMEGAVEGKYPNGTAVSVGGVNVGAGTYSNAQLGMPPVDNMTTLKSMFTSYFPGSDTGSTAQVTNPDQFPFIAVFVAGSYTGENRSFTNANMVVAKEPKLENGDITVKGISSYTNGDEIGRTTVNETGGADSKVSLSINNDIEVTLTNKDNASVSAKATLLVNGVRLNDGDTIPAGAEITVVLTHADSTNITSTLAPYAGSIVITYESGSKTKTHAVPVSLTSNAPSITVEAIDVYVTVAADHSSYNITKGPEGGKIIINVP